jgi:hypothetical protein
VLAFTFGVAFSYALLEGGAWLILKVQDFNDKSLDLSSHQVVSINQMLDGKPSYTKYSETLGWTVAENGESEDKLMKSNRQGFRANREYSEDIPTGKIRALTVGDSFTNGDEVDNQSTFQHFAESRDPALEVLNFGVPGYGVTQACLRFEEVAKRYKMNVAVLGIMPDDLRRSVNAYYPFRFKKPTSSPSAVAMPFARVGPDGEIVIEPPYLKSKDDYLRFLKSPVQDIIAMSKLDIQWRATGFTPLATLWLRSFGDGLPPGVLSIRSEIGARFDAVINRDARTVAKQTIGVPAHFRPDHPIFQANVGVAVRFAESVRKNGAIPMVLWLPHRDDIERKRRGVERFYSQISQTISSAGVTNIDAMTWLVDAIDSDKTNDISAYFQGGHYSAKANKIIGEKLIVEIRKIYSNSEN